MVQGIDVSDNQGVIDWAKVRQAGIRVAILRSVRGSGKADYQFENNFAGCRNNNIAVGVYKYSYATTVADAVNEAKQVVSLLNGRKLECRVWLDMEDKCQRTLPKQALTAIAQAFYNVIADAGYQFGIYCNSDWYNNVLDVSELGRFCEAWWIARYGTNTGQAQYQYKPDGVAGWQYTSKGSVLGISGYVDRDEYYESIAVGSADNITANQSISGTKYSIGQKVRFSTCYASSTDTTDKAINANRMQRDYGTITQIAKGAANPYLLDNGLCWCNDGDIRELIGSGSSSAGIKYHIGQKVRFSTCYASSTDAADKAISANRMQRDYGTITRVVEGAANPYLLDNGLCWCNDGDIRELL